MSTRRAATPDVLLARAAGGDRAAVARLLTLLERGGDDGRVVAAALPGDHPAHVVGVTGPPGAGKSTLTGHLLALAGARGGRPAALAVDPSSPRTGGAILGDRVRMDGLAHGAYVRSMATRGHHGGLADAVPDAVRLLGWAGFDPVIVETTGVGQVEVEVVAAADTTVLVTAPGAGDAVQADKAGLLEVADLLVVNKADRPGAADTRRDLESMLELGRLTGLERADAPPRPVLMTCAVTGDGVAEVLAALDAHAAAGRRSGSLARRREARRRTEVRDRALRLVAARLDEVVASPRGEGILADRSVGTDAAAAALARALGVG